LLRDRAVKVGADHILRNKLNYIRLKKSILNKINLK